MGSTGKGATSGTGSGATGLGSTGAAGSASSGTSTGVPSPDCRGDGGCSRTEFLSVSECSPATCNCDQEAVVDPALMEAVCETPCSSDADCPNAVTTCRGGRCAINACQPGDRPGDSCAASGVDGGRGSCIPISDYFRPDLLVCVPNGSATSCIAQANNDTPVVNPGPIVRTPQPRDASAFCGAGRACYSPGSFGDQPGTCEPLCVVALDAGRPCSAGTQCEPQDPRDMSWGFCLPCGSSGSDGGGEAFCLLDVDCCERNCSIGAGGLGLCLPPSR
jgi:hypothetical protein